MSLTHWAISLLAISIVAIVYGVPDYSDLPRGPYCERRGCCTGRLDQCAQPIVGTLCYCDDFCNRTRSEDCCPDYWTYCRHMPEPPPESSPEALRVCTVDGRTIPMKQSIKKNCNKCTCEPNGLLAEVMCETKECLVETDIINTVNQLSQTYGWTATNYSEFWGRSLQEGIELKLGTLKPERFVLTMNHVRQIYDPSTLPKNFDAEQKWPNYISPIQDQGWCGSSWAISTAAVASDRYAIVSKGLERVRLSSQHLLSCDFRGQQSCKGGYLDRAWNFVRKYGLVDEECFPYSGSTEKCRIPRRGDLRSAGCDLPINVERTDKYRTAPAYRLGNETDIMYEIYKSGPVQATIKVYHDFFTYSGGIYRHTDLSVSQRTGYHSVRIVGWGEEVTYNGVEKYWRVANSWGPHWGENGYFRIARGTDECEIESFVLGVWPEIEQRVINNEIQF